MALEVAGRTPPPSDAPLPGTWIHPDREPAMRELFQRLAHPETRTDITALNDHRQPWVNVSFVVTPETEDDLL